MGRYGQVEYDSSRPSSPITLGLNQAVALPPAGTEFDTVLSSLTTPDFDDDGGRAGVIRYVGTQPAVVRLTATTSFKRQPGSTNQHIQLGWAVGSTPLQESDIDPNTRQEADLAFDLQDTILHISTIVEMQPQDLAQVWVRQVPYDPGVQMIFLVNGFMLQAEVLSGGDQDAITGSAGNLVMDPRSVPRTLALPPGPALRLPTANEFRTTLVNDQDWSKSSEGTLTYTGAAEKVQRISGTVTVERTPPTLNASELRLYINVAPLPTDATKDLPTSQGTFIDVTAARDEVLHVEGLFRVKQGAQVELWLSNASTTGLSVRVLGYSLTITDA